MSTPAVGPLLVGRIGLYLALVWFLVWAVRRARRKSPVLGVVLAAGIIVRAMLGFLLFAISYLELPFLTNLQLGGGFWALAPDARSYFQAAAGAAHLGISSVPPGSASPFYVQLLALWMELVGVSPASAVLLNLVSYVVLAVVIVAASRAVRPAAIALGAVTLSPALIIFGTQALKDSVCVTLIVLAIAGGRLWVDTLNGTAPSPQKDGALGATYLSIAVFGFAGIRAYFALLIVVSVVAMACASIVIAVGRTERLKTVAGYAALLSLLWGMFIMGAGASYAYYASSLNPFRAVAVLDGARVGFVATGGATSLVGAASDEIAVPENPLRVAATARAAYVTTGGATSVSAPSASENAAAPKNQLGLVAALDGARAELVVTGSVTSVVARSASDDAAAPSLGSTDMTSDSVLARGARTLRGSAVMFVPITVLQALSAASFSGGQGLLLITDLDTLVMDAGVIASLLLLLRAVRQAGSKPVAIFALVLAALTIVSMAYVVTNYGTLFRLRLLAVTPMWVLPAFLELPSGRRSSRSE